MITKNPVNTSVYRIPQTPRVGLEPTTPRLTAACSTIELSRTIFPIYPQKPIQRLAPAMPITPCPSHTPTFPGQALDRLAAVSSVHCCTSTPALPTSSSPRGLTPYRMGDPILGGASRLDAFSAYPVRAWLPCRGIGMPTGAPVARPSRSSRTGDSPPQISCARAG